MDFVIAVDGPAASGKGTVAGRLAGLFGLPYLDTGLLYRAVGYMAWGLAPASEDLGDGFFRVDAEGGKFRDLAIHATRVFQFDDLGDPKLRTGPVGELASKVAAIPEVRQGLFERQRAFADQLGGAVLDGRDIGTVIAPDAAAKLFVTAAPEVRAERRWKQLRAQGEPWTFDQVLADIHARDARDSGRSAAPLVRAPDAVLLDTSDLTISQSVEAARRIVQAARSRWETSRPG